jgi:hypothetical protein
LQHLPHATSIDGIFAADSEARHRARESVARKLRAA